MKLEQTPPTGITDKHIRAWVNDPQREDKAGSRAILLSYHCGLRLGDICQLEWDCFAKPNTIAVWTDKRNRRVELPINQSIVDAISSIPVTSHQYVFPKERETILDTTRRAYLSVQFGRLCARFDIHGKTFHSLRHTFATEHHLEGRSLAEIAEALGHSEKSTEVTEGYVHEWA